ncbi:hypothetical protein GCM10027290_62240 [Micromonospora sonneratiae]
MTTVAGSGSAPAVAAADCSGPAEPGSVVAEAPPEQATLGFKRVWPTTMGRGVTVAVIDTGVDGSHPQLRGAVGQGWDFVDSAPSGGTDCVSHGTAVASLIAARPVPGIGFVGVAPEASILPVRVVERTDSGLGEPAVLARAIRWAVDHGARVVNISLVTAEDTADLRAAVRYANEHDVLLVAAAGTRPSNTELPDPADGTDPPYYPAAYPGVLGVGAVDGAGARLASSPVASYVDIAAPGGPVLAATRVRGHGAWSGTSFATGLVSGVAALVRAAEPKLTAAEVERRLLATANRVAGGPGTAGYTHGMVDPYRAVTEKVVAGGVQVLPEMPPRTTDPALVRAEVRHRSMVRTATTIGIGAVIVVVILALTVVVNRRRATGAVRPAAATSSAGPTQSPDLPPLEESYFAVPKLTGR